jgi:hypothetical protein
LPYSKSRFRSFGNAFPNNIYFNVSDPPPFKRVHQVELTDHDGPLTLALFQFVKRLFPFVERFYFSQECRLADFDWRLLPHFPRVTTLLIYIHYQPDDQFFGHPPDVALFRTIVSLLPNMRQLQTSTGFLKEQEMLFRTDQQLREVSERIEEVKMSRYDNKQMEEFVRSIFPNANIRFDY